MQTPAVAAAKQTDLLALVEPTTRLRKVAAHEWAGPCPRCGGHDRFRVDPNKGWWCRHCTGEPGSGGHWQDAIDFIQWYHGCDFKAALYKLTGKRLIDPTEVERRKQERERIETARIAAEIAARTTVRERLNREAEHLTFHANLDGLDKRELWRQRGLSDAWQDYYKLGYCPSRDWGGFQSDSLTIPYTQTYNDHGNTAYRIIGLKHRLLADNTPGGKYRPHLPGAGQALFYASLETFGLQDDCLIVEGEIKAMVTYASLWAEYEPMAPLLSVVGTAGHSPRPELLSEFKDCKRIWICLDPDAITNARQIADTLGRDRCKVLDFPAKIDDLILAGALDGQQLLGYMEY